MEEQYHNRIKFLWDAANSLTPTKNINRLIKSYYLNILKYLARNEKLSTKDSCEKCALNWYDGQFTLKLIPQKMHSTKAQKLVEQYQKNEIMTKKQKCRAKWYKKKISSFVEMKCNVCGHKTKTALKKPKKNYPKINNTVENNSSNQKIKLKKNKKIKKDKKDKKNKSAGLKITSNIKQQLEPKLNHNPEPIKDINPEQKSLIKINKKKSKNLKSEEVMKLKLTGTKFKPLANHQSNKQRKNVKKQPKQSPSISKTQQKNKLLQLAEILNKQSNQNHDESNNKLKQFLK